VQQHQKILISLLILTAAVDKITAGSEAFGKLEPENHFVVYRALLNPHWERIYLGGRILPPKGHSHDALQKLVAEAKVLEDPGTPVICQA